MVRKAIDTARRDGWNPIASIKLNCVKCNAPVSVAAGISATRLRFVHSDGHYGQCQPFDKPLTCQKCASNLFRVTVTPTHFKEWLRASLASLKPCDQDPALGFRDADTGEIFKHPKLRPSADFDDLWLAIHPYVDPFADFNPDASFDIIETRYLGKKVPCLRHHNEKSDIVVTILKDPTGNFWWTIDR